MIVLRTEKYQAPNETTIGEAGKRFIDAHTELAEEIRALRADSYRDINTIRDTLETINAAIYRSGAGDDGYILEYGGGFTHANVIEDMLTGENTMEVVGWRVHQTRATRLTLSPIYAETINDDLTVPDVFDGSGYICDTPSLCYLLEDLW